MTINKSTGDPISISEIATEFGGTVPHSLSEYIRGGSRVPNTTANNNIPTSNDDIMMSDFYGADNTPASAPLTAADITLVGRTYAVSSIGGATATVTLTLNNDGSMSVTHTADVPPTTLPGTAEWLRRANNAADTTKAARVEVRVTLAAGSTTGLSAPPVGTWLGLSTSRSWTLSGAVARSAALNFTFRDASTRVSLASVAITLRVN